MEKSESIKKTVQIISSELNGVIEQSLKNQREVAPNTTPSVYETEINFGASGMYSELIYEAVYEVYDKEVGQDLTESEAKHVKYEKVLYCLLINYLDLRGHTNIVQSIKPKLDEVSRVYLEQVDNLRSNSGSFANKSAYGRSEMIYRLNKSVVWIMFIPDHVKSKTKKEINRQLRQEGVDKGLRSDLVGFVDDFEEMI